MGSNSSFYNQNPGVLADTNPPSPVDTPVTDNPTTAVSSFYAGNPAALTDITFASLPWAGTYNAGTGYIPGDAVSFNGQVYVCKAATTGNDPTNTAFWDFAVAAGATGPQGPAGPAGPGGGAGIGNVVTGGTAGRILFEGAGPVLADSPNFLWNDTQSVLTISGSDPGASGVGVKIQNSSSAGDIRILVQGNTFGTASAYLSIFDALNTLTPVTLGNREVRLAGATPLSWSTNSDFADAASADTFLVRGDARGRIELYNDGSGTGAELRIWGSGKLGATNNERMYIQHDGSSGAFIGTFAEGTGVSRPISIEPAATEAALFDTDQTVYFRHHVILDSTVDNANSAHIRLVGRNGGTASGHYIFSNELGGLIVDTSGSSDGSVNINRASPINGNVFNVAGTSSFIDGDVIIGNDSDFANWDNSFAPQPHMQVIGDTANLGAAGILRFSAGGSARLQLGRSIDAIGTFTTALPGGQEIGAVYFEGSDSAGGLIASASLRAVAYANWSVASCPTYLILETHNGSGINEKMRILPDGPIVMAYPFGGSNAVGGISTGYTPFVQLIGDGDGATAFMSLRYSNDTNPGRFIIAKSRGTSVGTNTALLAGDQVGSFLFLGCDGTNLTSVATVRAEADANASAGSSPGRLILGTVASGSTVTTERVRIDSTGLVTIGVSGSNLGMLALAGNTSGLVTIQTNAAAGTWTATLPNSAGTNGYVLTTNGSGVLSWTAPGAASMAIGSAITSGTAGRVLYEGTGPVLADSANLTFNGTTLSANAVALGAGTTSVAPMTYQAGTNLTTAAAGSVEYDGNELFFSPANSDRRAIPLYAYIRQHAAYTLTSSTSAQKLFNGSANGALTLPVGVYEFECLFSLSAMSATSGNAAFSIAGTATAANFLMDAVGIDGATATAATRTGSTAVTSAFPASMVTAGTGTTQQTRVQGTFEVTVAGTIIPSIALVTASAAIVAIGSYFKIWRMGAATDTFLGNWS